MEIVFKMHSQACEVTICLYDYYSLSTPSERFMCSVEIGEQNYRRVIPAVELQDIFQLIRNIPLESTDAGIIKLDGVSYELHLSAEGTSASYKWWQGPGKGWNDLQKIADRFKALGTAISGRYLL